MCAMPSDRKKLLKRNIFLFGIFKIFIKRVFLPLTTIYATEQAGLSIQQIGLTAGIASGVSFLLDALTGHWADKYGRRLSAQIGSSFAVLGSAVYIVSTDFIGILSASIVLAIAYSFMNGSIEALMHDTLVELKRPDDYAKVASRAQSLSLVANSVLITVIPLLYPIDKRLPFVAGLIAYIALFFTSSLLTEPKIKYDEEKVTNFYHSLRQIINRYTFCFFFFLGVLYASSTGPVDTFNLGFLELGYEVKYLGFLFGITSLFGALVGLYAHNLKRLSFKQYATFDIIVNFLPFVAFGIFRSLLLSTIIFIINFSLWRYEQIMFQHYILKIYGTSRLKATIVSITTNFRSLHEVWIAISIASLAQHKGVLSAIGYSSWAFILLLPIMLISISIFEKQKSKS